MIYICSYQRVNKLWEPTWGSGVGGERAGGGKLLSLTDAVFNIGRVAHGLTGGRVAHKESLVAVSWSVAFCCC